MIEYGYINEGGYLRSRILEEFVHHITDEQGQVVPQTVTIEMQIEELVKMGWKPVDMVDESKIEASTDFSSVHIRPIDLGDRIGYEYVESFDPKILQQKIDELKQQLDDSDYKVTKSYEAFLIGASLPYKVEELHNERQKIRDEINRLEGLFEK